MSRGAVWIVIVVAGFGTYAIRLVFLALAHRVAALPAVARTGLRMIPPAALAALTAPRLLRPEGDLDLTSPELAAGLLALAVAWRTRSIPLTIVVGLVAVVVLQQLGLGG